MSAKDDLLAIAYPPEDEGEFASWLNADDAYSFLKHNANSDEVIIYSALSAAFINSVWLPNKIYKRASTQDLQTWNFNAYTGWGATVSFNPKKTCLSAPLSGEGPVYSKAEPLVFARTFSGRLGDDHYHDLLQRFVQVSGVHYLQERLAYCRIDQNGDVEEVIRVIDIPPRNKHDFGGTIITCKRDVLERYAHLVGSTLIRVFDFTRFKLDRFTGWGNGETTSLDDGEIRARRTLEPGHGSFTRGYQPIRTQSLRRVALSDFDPFKKDKRDYASFIIQDWRHKTISEVSTDPRSSANYFNGEQFPNLPFEASPAFFKPDVLAKYKSDTSKYRFDGHNICCRDTWSLRGLGFNEAGQVHTYLCYLRNLPYKEQLYWKSFNELPKGGISKASYKSDFLGCWDNEYEPLSSIKQWSREQRDKSNLWWTIKDEELLDKTHYPLTESPDEWADAIMRLDQLVVEGINKTPLQGRLRTAKRTVDPSLAPIKLIRECLLALECEQAVAEQIIAPLTQLHYLRTKAKGHASSNQSRAELHKRCVSEHGSLPAHFKALCSDIDRSMREITAHLAD